MEKRLKQGEIIGTIARQKMIVIVLLMQIWIETVTRDMEINFMEHYPTELSCILYLLIKTKCKVPLVAQNSYSSPFPADLLSWGRGRLWYSGNNLAFVSNLLKMSWPSHAQVRWLCMLYHLPPPDDHEVISIVSGSDFSLLSLWAILFLWPPRRPPK